MKLDLAKEDMKFLHAQLEHHLHEMEDELAHTEKRQLQAELAIDVTRMQGILHTIDVAVAENQDDF
jgi:hypothetical protein